MYVSALMKYECPTRTQEKASVQSGHRNVLLSNRDTGNVLVSRLDNRSEEKIFLTQIIQRITLYYINVPVSQKDNRSEGKSFYAKLYIHYIILKEDQ